MTYSTSLTIRLAHEDDRASLATLAQLDSSAPAAAPVLVAEAADRIVAAISLADGSAIADPFVPTTEVLEMLRLRAALANGDGVSRDAPRAGGRRVSWPFAAARRNSHGLAHRV
jgi:hypothetical protein